MVSTRQVKTRRPRPSFRDKVRGTLATAGIRGVHRDDLFESFEAYPRVKVTVALNELLGRREAYMRNDIYRLTTASA